MIFSTSRPRHIQMWGLVIFATGASTVKITIGASWETGNWCGGGSWICKNSPLYSDILCFVHILIEHYWKYNNKNNPDIKLSYKAKPIFALKLQQSKEFFFELESADWTEVSKLQTNNSSSIPMRPNEAKFSNKTVFIYTLLRNEQCRIGLSQTSRLARLDLLFFDLFDK